MSDFELMSGAMDPLFGVLFSGGIAQVIWWVVRRSDRNARADIERCRGEVPWNERPLNDEAETAVTPVFAGIGLTQDGGGRDPVNGAFLRPPLRTQENHCSQPGGSNDG